MIMVGNLWWHMPIGPTTKQRPSIVHMRGNALLFGQIFFSSAIYMVAHLFWLPIISPWSLLWNQINSQESWLDGHLSFMNMISILFTRLVGLIGMSMGWIKTQVQVKGIPQGLGGMEKWFWKQYQDGMLLHTYVLCWVVIKCTSGQHG